MNEERTKEMGILLHGISPSLFENNMKAEKPFLQDRISHSAPIGWIDPKKMIEFTPTISHGQFDVWPPMIVLDIDFTQKIFLSSYLSRMMK